MKAKWRDTLRPLRAECSSSMRTEYVTVTASSFLYTLSFLFQVYTVVHICMPISQALSFTWLTSSVT